MEKLPFVWLRCLVEAPPAMRRTSTADIAVTANTRLGLPRGRGGEEAAFHTDSSGFQKNSSRSSLRSPALRATPIKEIHSPTAKTGAAAYGGE
ncbi:hypothetical protein D3C73_1303720 [compost metagenome]